MKKLLDSIKYIKLNDLLAPFIFIIILPIALLFKLINKIRGRKLWLVCETGYSARDNGYHFYKYVREKHADDYCFYVIDKNSSDFSKVKHLGNIIQFKSLKHWLYYLAANYNISNQKYGNPNQPFFYIVHVSLGLFRNRVFLQHGITKDDSPWLYYKDTKFRYFICGAKREYDYVKEKFGYPDGNVIYTGFSRFDNLYNNDVNQKQILIMPTWRNWLGRDVNGLGQKVDFTETSYYRNWNSLLENKEFIKYIEENDYMVYFYPHVNMNKYLKDFNMSSKNIRVVDNSDIDIQKLLKESAVMITDYSSVYMDFAYMTKPVIYYQFDYKEYRSGHLQDGYFDYQKDSFGPVVNTHLEVIDSLKLIMNRGLEKKYLTRMNDFFQIKDQNNSERLYKILSR